MLYVLMFLVLFANALKAEADLLVFVSSSMSKESLKALSQEAKRYGGTLIVRGLKDNDFKSTVSYFPESFLIDPELFLEFNVTTVPTFVLLEDDQSDMMTGFVSLRYALEQFAKRGDLQHEAKAFLEQGS